MHGKAEREPAQHVVLDLVPLHNTCQSLPAVCYITSMQKAGGVSECENLGGGQKLTNRSQPFLDQSLLNFEHIVVNPCRLTTFFPVVDVPLQRYVRSMFKVSPKKRFLLHGPWGQTINARGVRTKVFK